MNIRLFLLAVLTLFSLAAFAESTPPIDESALFGATVLREIDPKQVASGTVNLTPGAALAATPLAAFVPTVRWGGSADAGVNAQWQYHENELPTYDRGSASVNSLIYFDARPLETSRFYTEAAVSQDLEKPVQYRIREMFLDASLDGRVQFRVGKQRIAWGVGAWFSPADVLSLEAIDLNDTGKKREGPFALKVDVPVGLHSLTLYTVLPQEAGVEGAAFAPRAEFLWGGYEVALAGYWRPDMSLRPRLIALATGTTGPFTLNLESVALWGSDRHWVKWGANGKTLEKSSDTNTWFLQAALGAGWSWTSAEQDVGLNVQAQYFYDGTGYQDPAILAQAASLIQKEVNKGKLSATDLANPGQQYLAGTLTVTKLWADSIALGGSGWINLSDRSFRVAPSIQVKSIPRTSLRLQMSWEEGSKGQQYSPAGRTLTPALRLSLFDVVNLDLQVGFRGSDVLPKASMQFTVPGF